MDDDENYRKRRTLPYCKIRRGKVNHFLKIIESVARYARRLFVTTTNWIGVSREGERRFVLRRERCDDESGTLKRATASVCLPFCYNGRVATVANEDA